MHEILIQLGTTAILLALVLGGMWGVGHLLKKLSDPTPNEWDQK